MGISYGIFCKFYGATNIEVHNSFFFCALLAAFILGHMYICEFSVNLIHYVCECQKAKKHLQQNSDCQKFSNYNLIVNRNIKLTNF